MKQNWIILAGLLWIAQAANALVVSTDTYGDIPEQGLEITIDETELDLMTGKPQMELTGSLISGVPVSVTIHRSQSGLEDQFCCADDCTNGNGELDEELSFTPDGIASWFVHYYPATNTNVTVTYTFSDGTDNFTITVHYVYDTQGTENVQSDPVQSTKVLRDGIIYIVHDNKTYHL